MAVLPSSDRVGTGSARRFNLKGARPQVLRRAGSPTGDLVRQDRDRYFFFVSCEKDIIRRRGENESAAELGRMIGAQMRGEKGDAFDLRQLRLLVGLGKFPLPLEIFGRACQPEANPPHPGRLAHVGCSKIARRAPRERRHAGAEIPTEPYSDGGRDRDRTRHPNHVKVGRDTNSRMKSKRKGR
jgi:hypothetical protein